MPQAVKERVPLTALRDEARELVRRSLVVEKVDSVYLWRIADLTAQATPENGQRPSEELGRLSVAAWAEEIGWMAAGRQQSTLARMREEARAWPAALRVPDATFWQHHEARQAHKDDIRAASRWLKEKISSEESVNITAEARALRQKVAADVLGIAPEEEKEPPKVLRPYNQIRNAILDVSSALSSLDGAHRASWSECSEEEQEKLHSYWEEMNILDSVASISSKIGG